MNDPTLVYFGLSFPPFTKEIPDGDLWLPPSREALVADMVQSIEARQSVLLAGEAGVGKTCVLRALRQRLPEERFRLTYCHNATLGRRDFYRQLCLALGLSPKATAAAVFYAVTMQVYELAQARVHPVFLLDEAHVAAVPGGAFGAPGYVRFSYATNEERIRGGIEAIKAAVARARG